MKSILAATVAVAVAIALSSTSVAAHRALPPPSTKSSCRHTGGGAFLPPCSSLRLRQSRHPQSATPSTPMNDDDRSTVGLEMATSTSVVDVDNDSPRTLVRRGMSTFTRARSKEGVSDSINLFDRAAAGDKTTAAYLWQRGLSYYYADQFREGSDQFRLDVSFNPLDVEEIVWDIACLARLDPNGAFPPSNQMSLPKGKTDRRRIMSTVYSLFRGDGATEHDLADAGHNGNISDEFYSLFYLGLYCEIRGETSKAESYMKAAAATAYATGQGSGDYMTSCARVHCSLRGWGV